MIRNTTFASLGILGALVAAPTLASAQAPTESVALSAPAGNVIGGGGGATLAGGGDDRSITYSSAGAGGGARYEQQGRSATFGGNSGDSPHWTYGETVALTGGREAWMVGGGDDLRVTYANPAGPRR
jgi:hypothetical protein